MKGDIETLVALALLFTLLSFLSVGGAISAMPEIHRQAVDLHHWMSDREFVDLVAIAQAAPGPNVLFVTLIGQHVAGVPGALIATVFMCGPACVVAFFIARAFDRFRDRPWRAAIQAGLVPVSIGLICATALIIARSANHDWKTFAVTAATFAVTYWTRVSPLYALGAAAAVGLAGLL